VYLLNQYDFVLYSYCVGAVS